MGEAVTVIMPTRTLAGRAALLRRAIASVLAQVRVSTVPLLVINGGAGDPALVRELVADRRLRTITLPGEGLPAALRAGRAHVDTAFFATLDDDDVLVPDALATRVDAALEAPGWDAIVTNGIRRGPHGESLHVEDAGAVNRDPLLALRDTTWLLPGSWLCRSDAANATLFDDMPAHLECTYLALRFATGLRMRFLARPTVIWHTSTPLSVSASREYSVGQAQAIERLLALPMPAALRASFEERLRHACHANAERCLEEGATREAWGWHMRSLRAPGGWRHLLYTRKVLMRAIGS